ncbi:hypothetical protein MASR2M18_18700 [Ignavibacteria bacterium]|nr:hypothetical protein [Bacteroidota bacterium]MCZ2131896.1 hypothetical protein [Bacteroidota bacterium]
MKTSVLLNELTALANEAGYRIIRDKGTFRGGSCIVRQEKIIVLNKRLPPESIIAILARVLADISENLSVKPALRDIIERERVAAPKRK